MLANSSGRLWATNGREHLQRDLCIEGALLYQLVARASCGTLRLLEEPMRRLLVGPVPARIGLLDLFGIFGCNVAVHLITLPARAGDAQISADLQPLIPYPARVGLHARAGEMPPAPAGAFADARDLLRRLVE